MAFMVTDPLFEWSDAAKELVGFLLSFVATGAIGFRLIVLGRRVSTLLQEESERAVYASAERQAALLGTIGAAGSLLILWLNLPDMAARSHQSVSRLLSTMGPAPVQFAAACVALAGFLLIALFRARPGWYLAATGVVAGSLANVFFGNWTRVANPIHRLAGGFWIGTLFVLTVAGVGATLRSKLPPVRRGLIAAQMVHSFSPLALTAAGVLAVTGAITAWTHLDPFSSLWTTPYGYALIAKLFVVAIVLGLGAWNWKRQRPLLGTESAAAVLLRSATAELLAAVVVLIITSVLVSLPSP